MPMFKIRYADPDTGKEEVFEMEFEDSHEPHFISAKEWAEDRAYMLADKGWYHVKETK